VLLSRHTFTDSLEADLGWGWGWGVDSINGKCALFKLINGFNLAHMKARAVRTVIKLMLQYFTVCSYIPCTVEKKTGKFRRNGDAKSM
jgi:hypothetical protein